MLNKAILIGRLCAAPELKYTQSGTAVCSFSIAVDRRFTKQGEERQTDFIPIVTWKNTAEFVSRYFTKGQMINVVGSLQVRSWENSNGEKRNTTEVVADEVNFCGDGQKQPSSGQNTGPAHSYAAPAADGFAPVEPGDDLPF